MHTKYIVYRNTYKIHIKYIQNTYNIHTRYIVYRNTYKIQSIRRSEGLFLLDFYTIHLYIVQLYNCVYSFKVLELTN